MKRSEIIAELRRFFAYQELVCDHTFKRFGSNGWYIMPTSWLHTLLVIRRDILQRPMICNNYSSTSAMYTQRGCRCNLCQIVRDETAAGRCYQSAHANNVGCDFTVSGMTAEEARRVIVAKQELLPYPIRLELDVSWLHIDGFDYDNGMKVNFFNG